MRQMTADELKIIQEWHRDEKTSYAGHYASSNKARQLHYFLGIPVVILSAIVGTSVFLSLKYSDPSQTTQIAVGLISMAVTVLGALQTFLRYSQRAEDHRAVGAKYAALYREIDQFFVCPPKDDDELRNWMTYLRERIDRLALESSMISGSKWKDF